MFFLILFFVLLGFLTIYYAQFRYSRRNLYKHAAKIPAVPMLPLGLGNIDAVLNVADLRSTCQKYLEQYGSTLRLWVFWQLVVLTRDPKHAKIVLNSPHCLDKDKRYNLANFLGNSLIGSPAQVWKVQRKILNPVFGRKIVDSFVDVFIKHSEVLVQQLEKEVGKSEPFDAHEYTPKCTLDFICETAMGVSVDAQIKKSRIMEVFGRINEILLLRAFKVWLHEEAIFRCTSLGREFNKIKNVLRDFAYKIIKKRAKEMVKEETELVFNENEKKPLLDHMLTLEGTLSHEEICAQVQTFIVAGTDTVAAAVQYCLVVLGMYKDVQEKVRKELDDVFGDSNKKLELVDLHKLEYLTMVIKETLRLYSPVGFVARAVNQDIDFGDFIVPQGATVAISIAEVHRNPEYWDNPLEFNPYRFLPEEVAKRHPFSFIPFSAGPRNCIGWDYAMIASKVLLVSILRSYKIDTKITPETMRLTTAITSQVIGGANITIEKV